MRISLEQAKEAKSLLDQGKTMQRVAHKFHVHTDTMRRVIRNYETYGESLWSAYPTALETGEKE